MIYTKEQLQFLKDNCKLPRKELAALFNQHFNLNQSVIAIAGTCKRNNFLRDKKDWNYQKGNIPPNKGTKGLSKANKASWKKGNKPHNYLPIGSECLTTKDRYIKVKIADPNKWELKQRLVWEKQNGPVPKGFCISFLDGNRQNCDISNLKLITRAENAVFNKSGFAEYPNEFIPTLRNMTKLKIVTNQGNKKLEKRGESNEI